MIERTFAQALDVGVGDHVTLSGRRFTVAGIAVTAAQAPYPNLCYFTDERRAFNVRPRDRAVNIGLVWTTESDARGLASPANPPTTSP